MSEASDWLTETVRRLEHWPRPSAMVIARVEHLRALVAERAEMEALLREILGLPKGMTYLPYDLTARIRKCLPPLPEAPR